MNRKTFFKHFSLNDNAISNNSRRMNKKANPKETDYTVCFRGPALIKKKSTMHSHKKARAFNSNKDGGGQYILSRGD